jgi:hypothetical protein
MKTIMVIWISSAPVAFPIGRKSNGIENEKIKLFHDYFCGLPLAHTHAPDPISIVAFGTIRLSACEAENWFRKMEIFRLPQ